MLSSWLCVHVLVYAAVSLLCIASFVRASTLNPGTLHVSPLPQGEFASSSSSYTFAIMRSIHHCRTTLQPRHSTCQLAPKPASQPVQTLCLLIVGSDVVLTTKVLVLVWNFFFDLRSLANKPITILDLFVGF